MRKEKVSFHTPGHKGSGWQRNGSFVKDPRLEEDITELPGLDELAHPSGVLRQLEDKAALAWGSESSLLSINGATAGIIASILLLSKRGTHILVPRNCHRSVISGLIHSGLEPIWFDPYWDNGWGIWGCPDLFEINNILHSYQTSKTCRIAGMIITSPTYAGTLANIQEISQLATRYNIPLVVDEAHGAHLQWTSQKSSAALNCGADIVIHSLHKTLSCPTQTGIIHISKTASKRYGFHASELRACLNSVQSSSPSYLFMSAIDKLVDNLLNGKAVDLLLKMEVLSQKLKDYISANDQLTLYQSESEIITTAVMIMSKSYGSEVLHASLMEKGIYPEALLGEGVVFFLGIGSQQQDIDILLETLDALHSTGASFPNFRPSCPKPEPIQQLLNPRKAFYMPSHIVPIEQALGSIAAEVFAPCPPGWPILIPGQKITDELISFRNIKSVRVIKELVKSS